MKAALGNWLETLAPWDSFFTGTWSRRVSRDGVLYGSRRYLRCLQEWAGTPIYAFLGVEIGPVGHLPHGHMLIGNVGNVRAYCGERKGADQWGLRCCMVHGWPWGYARALPYDPARGASHYVAKYIAKELADWELIGFPATPQKSFALGQGKP